MNLDRWNGFWHGEGRTFYLACFRIFFAFCLWNEARVTMFKSVFAIEGGFHLPYLSFLPHVSSSTYETLHTLQYPLILLLAIGLLARPACIGLLLTQGYIFFADQMNFRNHPYFFLLILVILAFAPLDDALSIRSVLRAVRRRLPIPQALLGSRRPLTAQRLIQTQVCIVYFYSGVHKLHPVFLRGDVLGDVLAPGMFTGLSGSLFGMLPAGWHEGLQGFLVAPATLSAMAVGTALTELSLALLLWFRPTRKAAMIVGIVMHLSIGLLMDIRVFSFAMIASYLLFLDPDALPRITATPSAAMASQATRSPVRS